MAHEEHGLCRFSNAGIMNSPGAIADTPEHKTSAMLAGIEPTAKEGYESEYPRIKFSQWYHLEPL